MLKAKLFLLPLIGFCLFQPAIRNAGSCSVPVFRYALERWKPDPYKGVFIYRGDIREQDKALLRQLEEAALDSDVPLNLRIREVSLNTFPEEKLREILQGPIPEKLPILAIWYPEQMGKKPPLWMIEPTQANVKSLTESPKRKNLAESLIKGDSVVWIFVPSGNPRKDAQAKALIRKELDLALDSLAKRPYFVMKGSRQKRLSYGLPILTLSRTDPEERYFLDMLLSSESDLHEFKDEPMVFPVFGRGRLLGCLFGEYISKKNIQGVISYLAGSCSCEVKAQNPGMDLLIPALWDRVVLGDLFVEDETELPELTSVMPDTPDPVETKAAVSTPELADITPAAPNLREKKDLNPVPAKRKAGIFTIYGITLGSAAVIVLFAGFLLSHRRRDQ